MNWSTWKRESKTEYHFSEADLTLKAVDSPYSYLKYLLLYLQIRKVKLREVKCPAQGQVFWKWKNEFLFYVFVHMHI